MTNCHLAHTLYVSPLLSHQLHYQSMFVVGRERHPSIVHQQMQCQSKATVIWWRFFLAAAFFDLWVQFSCYTTPRISFVHTQLLLISTRHPSLDSWFSGGLCALLLCYIQYKNPHRQLQTEAALMAWHLKTIHLY